MFTIFQYDFMIRAFTAGIIVSVIAPLIGIFLVVRRYSLIGDTLAHVSLLGVAGSFFLNINPVMGALISSVIASFGMELLRGTKKVYSESILALFLSGSLAGALILMGLLHGVNVNFVNYLFGSIATVTQTDVLIIAVLGMTVIVSVVLMYKYLFYIAVDEEIAVASGLRVKLFNVLLIVLTAVTVSLAMRVVGSLLVGALMVIPVITATQYNKGFAVTTYLSIFFSVISVCMGLFLSFYINLPSGATIVLSAVLLFLLSLGYKSLK